MIHRHAHSTEISQQFQPTQPNQRTYDDAGEVILIGGIFLFAVYWVGKQAWSLLFGRKSQGQYVQNSQPLQYNNQALSPAQGEVSDEDIIEMFFYETCDRQANELCIIISNGLVSIDKLQLLLSVYWNSFASRAYDNDAPMYMILTPEQIHVQELKLRINLFVSYNVDQRLITVMGHMMKRYDSVLCEVRSSLEGRISLCE